MPTTNQAINLEIRDVDIELDQFSLKVDSLLLPKGTTTVLLGPSGSGKSTLLNCIGMLKNTSKAKLLIDNKEVSAKEAHGKIVVIFQRPYLMQGSVEQNATYGLKIQGVARQESAKRVKEVLNQVGLENYEKRDVRSLSGGEAQRVALARALAVKPQALLLDEPLASLDPLLKRQIATEFGQILSASSTTALYVTHDFNEALIVADYIAVIIDGEIKAYGEARKTVSVCSSEEVCKFLNIPRAIPGCICAHAYSETWIEVEGLGTQIKFLADSKVRAKQKVYFSVRPEDVHVIKEEHAALYDNCVKAQLCSMVSTGEMSQLSFTLEDSSYELFARISYSEAQIIKPELYKTYLIAFNSEAVCVDYLETSCISV